MSENTVVKSAPKRVPLLPTQDDLPSDDGVPMETERHKKQMDLLIYSLTPWLKQHQGGYVGGNMFVYFSAKQLRSEDFRGPDVFVVLGVSSAERKSWVVWEEGKAPDMVIELLSEKTAQEDKETKKLVYQNQLRVPEYYWFDPFNPDDWAGFELKRGLCYEQQKPDAHNRLVSASLGLALIRWHGVYEGIETLWLRWATLQGELLLTPQEANQVAQRRAEAAERRAKTAYEEGEQQGQNRQAVETARKMLAKGYKLTEIAELTGVSANQLADLSVS